MATSSAPHFFIVTVGIYIPFRYFGEKEIGLFDKLDKRVVYFLL